MPSESRNNTNINTTVELVKRVQAQRVEQGADCNCGGCEYCDPCKTLRDLGEHVYDMIINEAGRSQ